MSRRNYVEEILSVRLRIEMSPRWGVAFLRLLALEVSLQKLDELPAEVIKYFSTGAVAVLEAYFRSAIAQLIDHGPPFSENAARFEKRPIQGKKITLGELVGHWFPSRASRIANEKVEQNPAHGVRRKTENNSRVRFLTPEEEEKLRKAIALKPQPTPQ